MEEHEVLGAGDEGADGEEERCVEEGRDCPWRAIQSGPREGCDCQRSIYRRLRLSGKAQNGGKRRTYGEADVLELLAFPQRKVSHSLAQLEQVLLRGGDALEGLDCISHESPIVWPGEEIQGVVGHVSELRHGDCRCSYRRVALQPF